MRIVAPEEVLRNKIATINVINFFINLPKQMYSFFLQMEFKILVLCLAIHQTMI